MTHALDELTIKKLSDAAREAVATAFAPVSGFKVGAALLCEDGEIFTGANVETPSLLFVLCAERLALAKALTAGKRRFKAIAVYSSDVLNVSPCGICRQALFELQKKIPVVMLSDAAPPKIMLIEELLPFGFAMNERSEDPLGEGA